ncbi:MAG: hypothetical protein ACI3Z8_06390 [Paludibacteraceae bacterium]
MKTKIFFLSAVAVIAALSFTACDEPMVPEENPGTSQDRTIVSAVVVARTTISNDLASLGNMQLLRNGVVVKTFTVNDTVCTLADTITTFPDSITYVLDGKLDETKVDSTRVYRISRSCTCIITNYNAAGEAIQSLPGMSDIESSSIKGERMATYFATKFPRTIGTIRVTK